MVGHGRGALFFGLILPHGLLELTAVFVAAGAGLRLFWSWIEPGPRTRAQAIAHEGRTAVAVALGLAVVLLVSGVIEAFVTPSRLPTWARLAIGIVGRARFPRLRVHRRAVGAPAWRDRRRRRGRRRRPGTGRRLTGGVRHGRPRGRQSSPRLFSSR